MTLAQFRIHKRRSVIRRLATAAARNVTNAGGCSAESHNIRTIEHAIIEALNWKPKRRKK